MNKWLIQIASRKQAVIAAEVAALEGLNYQWSDFGIIYQTQQITNLENIFTHPHDTYIFRGGSRLLTLLNETHSIESLGDFFTQEQLELGNLYLKNLKKGIFYDVDNFDQKTYSQLDLPLLNNDAIYLPLNQIENLGLTFEEAKFIKPSKDLKAFTAGLLEPGTTVYDFIISQPHQLIYKNEELLVASPKDVQDEYRFFVLGSEVITGSQYRADGVLKYQPMDSTREHQKVLGIAQEYASLYKPAEIFTMDICRDSQNNYSIVEYNCFNISGLYYSDIPKLFSTLQEYMETVPQPKMKI